MTSRIIAVGEVKLRRTAVVLFGFFLGRGPVVNNNNNVCTGLEAGLPTYARWIVFVI